MGELLFPNTPGGGRGAAVPGLKFARGSKAERSKAVASPEGTPDFLRT